MTNHTHLKSNKGLKYDKNKLRYDLIPPEILEELAYIYTIGAAKYGENTWQNVEINRYIAAAFRHLEAYRKGEFRDNETGRPHLAHFLWNAGTILFLAHHSQKD